MGKPRFPELVWLCALGIFSGIFLVGAYIAWKAHSSVKTKSSHQALAFAHVRLIRILGPLDNRTIRLPARVLTPTLSTISSSVHARVAGVFVGAATIVSAGKPLCQLELPGLNDAIQDVSAQLMQAKAQISSQLALPASQRVTSAELMQVINGLEVQLNHLKEKRDELWVTHPLEVRVTSILIHPKQWVNVGQPLFLVKDLRSIQLLVSLTPSLARGIKKDVPVEVKLNKQYADTRYKAYWLKQEGVLELAHGQQPDIRPDDSVTVEFESQLPGFLRVPAKSVQFLSNNRAVLYQVRVEKSRIYAVEVPIRVVNASDALIEIEGPLKMGMPIVLESDRPLHHNDEIQLLPQELP
jgi:multidrug efflux pump subunit AcrA (membrane-fusion protein)